MSRLTIDISEQQHQSLEALAALQGKTIRYGRNWKHFWMSALPKVWRATFQPKVLARYWMKNPAKIAGIDCSLCSDGGSRRRLAFDHQL